MPYHVSEEVEAEEERLAGDVQEKAQFLATRVLLPYGVVLHYQEGLVSPLLLAAPQYSRFHFSKSNL